MTKTTKTVIENENDKIFYLRSPETEPETEPITADVSEQIQTRLIRE
jgi:hypothetical protein